VAEKRKSAEVEISDIKRVYTLFVDVKRSTQFLMEYQNEYMFNELGDESDDDNEDESEEADEESREGNTSETMDQS
jgi:RuvB-like protein 2